MLGSACIVHLCLHLLLLLLLLLRLPGAQVSRQDD
jgi:hypothetical protein